MGRISEKSDLELQKLYLLKVQSSVQSLERQYEKLSRAWRAREHQLDNAQKDRILEHISNLQTAFRVSIEATDKTADDKFRLITDAEKEAVRPSVVAPVKPVVVQPVIQKPTVQVKK